MLPEFNLIIVSSVHEVFPALEPDWFIIAGGTELVPAMRIGALQPQGLVDINGCSSLSNISDEQNQLAIGALVTHYQISKSETVKAIVPVLARTCLNVGNARVRSTGTIGGNLCFAEPRSDLSIVLVALGASLELMGDKGERQILIEEFLVGAFATAIANHEILTKIIIPLPARDVHYWKIAFAERPLVGLAYVESTDWIDVVVGASTEKPITGRLPRGDGQAAIAWVSQLEIYSDHSGSEQYKRHLITQKLLQVVGTGSQ